MKTITLLTGQVSEIVSVAPGTRITSSGNGSIEWTPGSLSDAKNSATWTTWAKGSSAGYMDSSRQMCIRAVATDSMTVTISEGEADKVGVYAYWEEDVPVLSTDSNGNTVLTGAADAKFSISSKSVGSRAIFIGTSITGQGFDANYYNAAGWFVPMNVSLNWPITTLIDAAVSGQNTTDMVTNWNTAVAAYYDDFDIAFIEIGPNDANGPTVSSATTVSNIETMTNTLLGKGKTVVILTPTPATTHTLPAELAHMSYVTAWLKDFAESKENVFIADAGRAFVDPDDGYANTTMSADGTHPSYPGAAVIGKKVASVLPLTRPISRASSFRRDHKEYANNPFFNGAYATGTRGFGAGTGVTGSGPESVTVGTIGTGTFSSIAVSKGTSLDDNRSSLIITAAGASANWACVAVRIGSTDTGIVGSTQRGRHDQNWAAATTYTVGDYARHSTITDGIFCCVAVVAGNTGASGGTQPTPTAYGEIITDNGVIWMWQKLPAVGDVMFAEGECSITGLTGGIAPRFGFMVQRAAGETFADGRCPYFDISGASGNPPTTWPLSGRYVTPEITLVSPGAGILVRHVWVEWRFYFTTGGGATIEIPYSSLRMV